MAGYTKIEDLPELGDVEGQLPRHDGSMNKFIRGGHQMMQQAGMQAYAPPPQHPPQEMMAPPPPPAQPDWESISCLDINRHITQCPICSRFYGRDNTVYIIAIIVLCIVCLLLLKRVLNV
jgi:hypothetical protein